jgi:N,N'-diacetyllegionaminate synthase
MRKVLIIAEAGVNHNGDFEKAKELVRVAADAGADFVKFQTFKAEKLVTKSAQKAQYQQINYKEEDNSQFSMLKKLEMPEEWYLTLIDYANSLGIKFLSTGFDEESIDFLESFEPELYKLPSGEIINQPLMEHIAKKGKPIILSTGMADIDEIKDAVRVIENAGLERNNITVLHCNTEYPTPMEDVNLKAMLHIERELGVEIGYSDHTLGIEVPIAAVALGARVIEKHFTLDKNLPGPDHRASLEPDELKNMVSAIRNIELAISGSGVKEPSKSEIKNKILGRKSLHASRDIEVGESIRKEDILAIRPGDGISPMDYEIVVGKKAGKRFSKFEKITLDQLI